MYRFVVVLHVFVVFSAFFPPFLSGEIPVLALHLIYLMDWIQVLCVHFLLSIIN